MVVFEIRAADVSHLLADQLDDTALWLANLLTDPAALGSFPGISIKNRTRKLSPQFFFKKFSNGFANFASSCKITVY